MGINTIVDVNRPGVAIRPEKPPEGTRNVTFKLRGRRLARRKVDESQENRSSLRFLIYSLGKVIEFYPPCVYVMLGAPYLMK
jgi:hypothetical protein